MASEKNTSGLQFVNVADLGKVCEEFINFYYGNINSPDTLFESGIFTPKTIFNVNGDIIDNDKIIEFITSISHFTFTINHFQLIPDGSRRMDILVKALYTDTEGNEQHFTQTFGLIERKGSFFVKNSNIMFL